ncbi:hypothetical protein PHISCL_09571 [Aspergillus sclerotialis]|uniref:Uncharacterized protein n=1 Tax=Aspergillus sclerotialis TaxID=2070753 RepID=A0A3A2ZLQ4_9EURO|nr:hypothetical protein PHISCL_09571 [Aspergillus sclerotialis]
MPNPLLPLRTALIGLSSTSATSWASETHLPTLLQSGNFALTALSISSIAAAKSAIKTYNLPPSTKAYGTPEDLANDPDIDLVICNTRVDKHFETVLPSIRAGKQVYIEWPIARNLKEVEVLIDVARAAAAAGNGAGRVAVGLQGRFAPPVVKVGELLKGGHLGKLLSSEVRAFGGTKDREVLSAGLKYFLDGDVGGNVVTIGFGHVIDFVQSVVGDIIPGSESVHFQNQRPEVRIRDPQSGSIIETIRSNVPDLISLHGYLPETSHVSRKASLIAYFTRGQPYPGDPSLSWTLNCEFGTIRLTAPAGISLGADAYAEPVTIEVHRFETGEVEQVPWTWSEAQAKVSVKARSVQSCLVSFAEGREDGYVSLEDAAHRASQIQGWLDSWEGN